MTTREKFKKFLTDKGMFDEQAEEVMKAFIPKADSLATSYQITWDRPAEEYAPSLYSVLSITLKEEAIKWIDTNCPKAWYREMFI
jgi:hypothetical protein